MMLPIRSFGSDISSSSLAPSTRAYIEGDSVSSTVRVAESQFISHPEPIRLGGGSANADVAMDEPDAQSYSGMRPAPIRLRAPGAWGEETTGSGGLKTTEDFA